MSLSFLPEEVLVALSHINLNFVTELRLRRGQPVVAGYKGEYKYLGYAGLTDCAKNAVIVREIAQIINRATDGCVYNYTEQMKSGFITVGHGVRIGIAGEYVTEGGAVNAVKNVTSLNIRIPHDVKGCAESICNRLYKTDAKSTLIFSKPGLGKTTMLRDIARFLSADKLRNVLVLDERNEIAAMDGFGDGFDLGSADVVRCCNKIGAVASAIRAMKPDVIITDELYGEGDLQAVKYAADCGICIVASSHITDTSILKQMPFEYFVRLTALGGEPEIYDKNFNSCCDSGAYDLSRCSPFGW